MPPLKVLSLNIQEGCGDRVQSIVALLRAQDADFVALLEANSRDNAQVLARQLGMALTYGEANCPSAVAWLSRFPLRRIENHRTPALAKTLLELEAIWDGARCTSLPRTSGLAGTRSGPKRRWWRFWT
jgi:exodeoxyribonuclease III